MKIGDVSRYRRFADPIRQRWYAYYRAVRFAQRMTQGPVCTQLPFPLLPYGALDPLITAPPSSGFPSN
jgi:hypothetical protein